MKAEIEVPEGLGQSTMLCANCHSADFRGVENIYLYRGNVGEYLTLCKSVDGKSFGLSAILVDGTVTLLEVSLPKKATILCSTVCLSMHEKETRTCPSVLRRLRYEKKFGEKDK